jgi:ABC-2 type transport system ATP-binding protein
MSNILEIKEVSKQYGSHIALDNISLSIVKGSILGMLGPNGAGKTSLIRIITQITAPDRGEVLYESEKLSEKHISQIGYLPEERGLYKKMSVGEQLIYLARLKGLSREEAKLKVNHWIQKFSISEWWEKNIEDLSKGMQQKVQFIATVIHEPKLVILDEPFTGFDPLNVNLLKDEILELKKKGTTIIFSTHRMETVEELCDDIVMINKSKIVLQGSKNEIKATFRTNTYQIISDQELTNLSAGIELIGSVVTNEGIFKSEIRSETKTSNELIAELISKVTVHSFIEKVPDMNQIFINVLRC